MNLTNLSIELCNIISLINIQIIFNGSNMLNLV